MFLVYIIAGIISLFISYFIFRWIFAIDKRIKQNNTIIELLKKLSEKYGVNESKIGEIIKKEKE